jgi:hypothetical protein
MPRWPIHLCAGLPRPAIVYAHYAAPTTPMRGLAEAKPSARHTLVTSPRNACATLLRVAKALRQAPPAPRRAGRGTRRLALSQLACAHPKAVEQFGPLAHELYLLPAAGVKPNAEGHSCCCPNRRSPRRKRWRATSPVAVVPTVVSTVRNHNSWLSYLATDERCPRYAGKL